MPRGRVDLGQVRKVARTSRSNSTENKEKKLQNPSTTKTVSNSKNASRKRARLDIGVDSVVDNINYG